MEVVYSKQAAKALNGLDKQTQQRIRDGIGKIPKGDIKRLEGRKVEAYRLRIGGWRILFSYVDDATVSIEKIAPRGAAYKGV